TPYHDQNPVLSADGKTLYFSSEGHNSIGGFDIFKSQLQADGTWGKPVNLGYPINNTDDDLYFIMLPDSNFGYYASDRPGGFGGLDIYRAEYIPLVDTSEATFDPHAFSGIDEEKQPEPPKAVFDFLLSGTVTDGITGVPLKAYVQLIDRETNQIVKSVITDPQNGKFFFQVLNGRKYRLNVESEGYMRFFEDFESNEKDKPEAQTHDVSMQRMVLGSQVVLGWQFFQFDKFDLQKETVSELDQLAEVLNGVPHLRIEIIGHTDSDGPENYNLELSIKRAQSVANYLHNKGIANHRMVVKGYGEKYPLYENKGKFKKWNRRVEIYILPN
ncbi:MAG: OmpA family protein, partial [Bacteroidia bacterium]|nr:OmpA family protein [Bacteroidia bacterium]